MTTKAEKLTNFFKERGLSQKDVAEKMGTSTAYINAILNNRKDVGKKQAEKMENLFGLSASWLLTGSGEMLTSSSSVPSSLTEDVSFVASVIPLLPVSAQAGSLNEFVTSVRLNDCEKVVSPAKGADFALPVTGDSMAPEFPNGSQVHVKKINERAFIEWGKVYVLDTVNGTVIKRIVPSDREGYVRCLSINPAPIYAPFEVALTDVYGIYRVLLCLSIK